MLRLIIILLLSIILSGCSFLASLATQHLASSSDPLLHVKTQVGDNKYKAQGNKQKIHQNHGQVAGDDHITFNTPKNVTISESSWYNVLQLILIIILTFLVSAAYGTPILRFITKPKNKIVNM